MSTPRPPQLDTGGKFASPAATIRSLSQLLEDDGHTPLATAFSSRPVSRSATAGLQRAPSNDFQLQSLLAAKESEAALLRQQLAQLTADFKFNLKLLEERDAELERVESVVAGLRESAASRDAALQEARRSLADRDAALRDKQARVAALEERQKQLVELCERQVADARASRDKEVARCQQDVAMAQGEAARTKAEVISSYERQMAAAAASEREARQRVAALAGENEHVRSQLQRAEARIAEQELAMQRMVSQFEGALGTLRQLEAQYDGLAADAGAADQLRVARIADLEREAEGLRVSRAALQQERDASVAQLSAALAEADAAATEAKQQYHRAMMDAAELTEALSEARQEAAQQRGRAQAAEEAAAEARAASASAQSALEREAAAHARTSGLLEAARLHQETARRDAQEQEQLVAQLREAAAAMEAERNDCAQAADTAQVKVQVAEERAELLAEQLEQERRLHSQLLDSREAEVAAQWQRALEAAQGERATLQQALDLANRQLQAAHRDTETLRLQVQHLRLAAGVSAPPPLPGSAGGGSTQASPDRYAGAARSGGGLPPTNGTVAAAGRWQAGSTGASEGLDGSEGQPSPAGSRDVFSELGGEQCPAARLHQEQAKQRGRAPAASSYQQQLHRHIDALAGKLSTFQRAVEEARLVGQQASQQLAESSTMLPAELRRRQDAVADHQLQQALLAERQQFEEERRQLDQQLAEQQAQLREREAELQRLQQAEQEERRRERQQQEQQRQQALQEQRQRLQQLELEASLAGSQHPAGGLPAGAERQQVLGQRGRYAALAMQLPVLTSGATGAALPAQRRSVSAALAAVGGSRPAASLASQAAATSRGPGGSGGGVQQPAQRANGGLTAPAAGTARPAPLRAAMGSTHHPAPVTTGGEGVNTGASAAEDPLARARRQVLAAKQYLKSVAELSGRPATGSSGST